MIKKIIISVLIFIFIILVGSFLYFSDYYEADEIAMSIYNENGNLTFEGERTDIGFIIYPGAKVVSQAYVGIAQDLSEQGYTSVIADFPLHISFTDINYADKVIEQYPNIEHWIIIGHSLGGVTASMYALDNTDKIDGLVYLASYSSVDLSDTNIKTLSIRGSNDTVLEIDGYNNAQSNYNDSYTEVIIQGGNHAGFGNYGEQNGDGENTIGYEKQQNETVDYILQFVDYYTNQ